MAANSRFAVSVHILAYLAFKQGEPVTSAEIASSVDTHPVLIRRLLTLLIRARLVTAQKGARGGYTLASAAQNISLRDVYRAVESATDFGLSHFTPNTRCPVGNKIAGILEKAFAKAQAQMESELAAVNIAAIHRAVTSACTAKR